jgi:protein-disulfide isomerase
MPTTFKRRPLAVAAVIAVGAAFAVWIGGMIVAAKDDARSPRQIAAALLKPGPLPELVLGQADAPVTIVEYADLTCPHCAHFHAQVLPLVKERYIDTGKARLIFREFPLNTHSLIAFMSVRCVPQENAFPLLAALFAHQDDWTQARSTEEMANRLFPYAQQMGLTRAAFDACVPNTDSLTTDRQRQLFKDIAAVGEHAANDFGVSSTPTFFVNGAKLSGPTIEDFDKAIAAALGK